MRRAAVLALASLLVAAPAAQAWKPHVRSARSYAKSRAGNVSFALHTGAHLYRYRSEWRAPSASVVKAMLMVAYLRHRHVRRRPLRAPDRALLSPMIRRSDNVAASRVRNFVGNGGLYAVARRARMRRFVAAASWGSSQITAADQARFFLRIDRLVPRRHRRYAMRLLNTIVRPQRWGVARARPRGWAIYFKGGWGSGSGAVDHQVALLRRGGRRLAVAVMTTGNPGHAYGKATLRGVTRRLLRGLRPDSVPR
jgi:beta-lactamase class A